MQMFTIGELQMLVKKVTCMWAIHAQLWELIALGCTPLTYFMELQVSFDLPMLYVANYYIIVASC